MTHLRLAPGTGNDAVPSMLCGHDDAWANAELRMATVATIDGASGPQRELLCVGIDRSRVMDAAQKLQEAGLAARTLTTSLFAAMQGFERLQRREDDELHTTLHVHIEASAVVAAMTHGSRCVLSRALRSPGPDGTQQWQDDGSEATGECNVDEIERRQEQSPKSLHALSPVEEASFAPLADELHSCILHHDAIHPDRSVDRLVFTGEGACDRRACGAIASHVGIPAFLGDPSKWLGENRLAVAGPAWAAAAGLCLRPMGDAA
jgi:Tfp pilus assembly PilM family ATPase